MLGTAPLARHADLAQPLFSNTREQAPTWEQAPAAQPARAPIANYSAHRAQPHSPMRPRTGPMRAAAPPACTQPTPLHPPSPPLAPPHPKAGAAVMVADIDQAAIDHAVSRLSGAGIKAAGARCDVSRAADVDGVLTKTQEELGGVDILVANAGGRIVGVSAGTCFSTSVADGAAGAGRGRRRLGAGRSGVGEGRAAWPGRRHGRMRRRGGGRTPAAVAGVGGVGGSGGRLAAAGASGEEGGQAEACVCSLG
jgi:hypothetical protein